MTPNSVEDDLDVIFNPFFNELQFQANMINSERDEFFSFTIANVFDIGEYQLLPISKTFQNFSIFKSYNLDTLKTRRIFLNVFDTDNEIVSGTFEFTLFRESDTLKITEGRFDAKYRN